MADPQPTWQPLPFEEATRYFETRVPMTPAQAASLQGEERLRAFTVSGLTRDDLVANVLTALHRAQAEGTGFAQFKKDIAHVIEEKGWTGPAAWRLDNIYRTNIQQALGTGHLDQQLAARGRRPYWKYVATMDHRTRPSHRALNGKILPADDPFWQDHYPPWDYQCRCHVVSVSAERVRAAGLDVTSGRDLQGPIEYEPGKFTTVLANDFTNPMRQRQQGMKLAPTAGAQDTHEPLPGLSTAASRGMRPIAQMSDPPILPAVSPVLPGADGQVSTEDLLKAMGVTQGRATATVRTRVGTPALLDEAALEVIEPSLRAELAPLVPQILQQPFEVWLAPHRNARTGSVRLHQRFLGMQRAGDGVTCVVVELVRGRCQSVVRVPVEDVESWRLGLSIFRAARM